MEIVSILRLLRRHLPLVVIGGFAALFVGLSFMYEISPAPPTLTSRAQSSGEAAGRVLIAAREEPAFDVQSKVADTLSERAALLADLMSTDAARERIAQVAGVEPDELAVLGPSTRAVAVQVALAVKATEVAAAPRKPYVLAATVEGQVPIISLRAGAPDSAAAARIVDAAAGDLDELIASRSSRAPALDVQRLGPAVESTIVDGPKLAVAVLAAFVIYGLWCAAIVVAMGFAHRRRHRSPAGSRRPRTA